MTSKKANGEGKSDHEERRAGINISPPVLKGIAVSAGLLVGDLVVSLKEGHGSLRPEAVTNLFFLAALGWCLTMLWEISHNIHELKHESKDLSKLVREKAEELETLSLYNVRYHEMLVRLLHIFGLEKGPTHEAVRKTMMSLVRSVHIDGRVVSIANDHIYRTVSEKIWEALVDAQHRANQEEPRRQIRVYAAHLARVGLWESLRNTPMWTLQKRFRHEGGIIYRVLLHGSGNPESPKRFLHVLDSMRANDFIQAFYLDLRKDSNRKLDHDFFIAAFDDEYHSIVWDTDFLNKNGDVKGCRVEVGFKCFSEHWGNWLQLMERLGDEESNPPQPPECENLRIRPSFPMFQEMKNLPRPS